MTISKVSILILVLSFFSCQNNYKENNFESSELLEDTKLLQILFFKKEQKVELWSTNSVNKFTLVKSYLNVRCNKTPIGIFHLNIENTPLLVLKTPYDFFGKKSEKKQFEDIYIVNKLRKNTNQQSIIFSENDLIELLSFIKNNRKPEVFVFPNDLRQDGSFEACFGCPHRMAELYSSLELHLRQFAKKN